MTRVEAEQIWKLLSGTGKLPLRILTSLCDGSIKAGLFLQQLLYWTARPSRRGEDTGGWVYKSSRQWFEEIGLTRRAIGGPNEKGSVRAICRNKGFVEEKLKGRTPRTVHYRITNTFAEAVQQHVGKFYESDETLKLDWIEGANQRAPCVKTSQAETVKPSKERESTPNSTAEIMAERANAAPAVRASAKS